MQGAEPHAGIYVDGQIVHLSEAGILSQPPHIASQRHGRLDIMSFNAQKELVVVKHPMAYAADCTQCEVLHGDNLTELAQSVYPKAYR